MLSTSSKRPREDYLNGDADDDGPAPSKMCKSDESLWSSGDYYAGSKCYQCSDSSAAFYGGSPFACDHYSGPTAASPTHQCWPAASSPASQQSPAQSPQQISTSPPHPSLSQPSPQQAHHLPPHLHPSHLPHHQSAVSQSAANPHLANHLCSNSANSTAPNHLTAMSSPLSAGTATYHHPLHHEAPPASPHQHQHHHHHHHHLQQQQQQQTIRCDENGKSYLDLGSGSSSCLVSGASASTYCAGRSPSPSPMGCALAAGPAAPNAAGATTIAALNPRSACNSKSARCGCGIDDYERRRINVLNLSMFKLGKYRAFPDPSLYRSVLICNTLRHIEREMEQEGCFGGGGGGGPVAGNQQAPAAPPFFMLEPPPEPPRAPTPYPQTGGATLCAGGAASGANCATSLGSGASSSGSSCGSSSADEEDGDSGIGDDNRSINWGSVLSLSSQSDLDPLNNNDSLGELDFSQELDELIPASCKLEDILKQVPSAQPPVKESPDIENIMQVLRFTTS